MAETMRVAMYARVSTRDKDQNPETQLFNLRSLAQNRGWEVVGEFVDEASAKDMKARVRWRDMTALARKRGFDVLLVLKLDRAFRSVKDTYDGIGFFQRYNIDFVAATQPFDTTTSTGRLMLGVLASVAEFEREMLVERINEGLARARAEGKHLGRPKGKKDQVQRSRIGYLQRYRPTQKVKRGEELDLYPLA